VRGAYSATGDAVALAAGAGLTGSVQIAVMGRLGGRIGTLEALALAFATALSLVIVVALLLGAVIDRWASSGWSASRSAARA
jgi:tetrahydromethanopterin S-methyltransferase subunit D